MASLVAATLVGVSAGQSIGTATVDRSLTSLRSSGSQEVAAQLGSYERLVGQLASRRQTSAAIADFSSALVELSTLSDSDVEEQLPQLLDLYNERYLEPLRAGGELVRVRDVVSDSPAAIYLQAAYALLDIPSGEPIVVDDAGDGSTWSEVHRRIHPEYRTAVSQAGLLDLYLVDAESERIVYSATKGPDLGTSLAVGPYSGSVVARAADAAATSDDAVVTDLSFYAAVPESPVGAAAAPVRDGNRLVGAVVITYDAAVYTQRLTAVVDAGTDDETTARDLYVFGADGTTRSDPQSYLADPEGFLDASQQAGVLTQDERSVIERDDTTVLVQPVVDSTVNAALEDDTDVRTGTGMTGTDVLTTTDRVPFDDVEWYAVAEVDASISSTTVATFRRVLVVGAAVFVVALAFVAVAWANRFMRPVRDISERLGHDALTRPTAEESRPITIPARSPIEFHRLTESFTAMGSSLRGQQHDLAEARTERLSVLESMLPASVAQRIARGEIEALDEVPSASVVVAVVLGLGDLVGAADGGDRRVIDELHAELDDIAFEHGLDRVKVVGDSYFAACGHDRPYIDHAPRAVAFAERVAETVRDASRSASAPLDTAIGINTGPVTVGMSGGARLVYDVWGPTVSVAHDLARAAQAGQIVVTDATRARLPEEIELAPWDAAVALDGRAGGSNGLVWTVVVPPRPDVPTPTAAPR